MQNCDFYTRDLSEISICPVWSATATVTHGNEKVARKYKINTKIIFHTMYSHTVRFIVSWYYWKRKFSKAKKVLEGHMCNTDIRYVAVNLSLKEVF